MVDQKYGNVTEKMNTKLSEEVRVLRTNMNISINGVNKK